MVMPLTQSQRQSLRDFYNRGMLGGAQSQRAVMPPPMTGGNGELLDAPPPGSNMIYNQAMPSLGNVYKYRQDGSRVEVPAGPGDRNPRNPRSPRERDMFSQGIFGNPQRPTLQNRGPQNLQGQLQRQLGGLRNQMRQQFERTQGPETTNFVEINGEEFRVTKPIPVSPRPPQQQSTNFQIGIAPPPPPPSNFNRGINPGGMYTGGRGGGFGSPFGGNMRGGRQQPPAAIVTGKRVLA